MIDRIARWRHVEGEGLQQVTLAPEGHGLDATGVVVGADDDGAFAGWFHIAVDAGWYVTRFAVHHTAGKRLLLQADGPGRWTDERKQPVSEFDGCVDIDISTTPFTNTLPIRRLPWQAGQSRELDMLYVPFDTLAPRRDRQRYTCLEPGRRFRYEGLRTGFTADIGIDDDGLVVDYPGLFRLIR
jgi:hypothetical protein